MSEPTSAGWKRYFKWNTDHKVIGVQYLVTTFFFYIVGGALAMVVRTELFDPEPTIRRRAAYCMDTT